MYRNEQPVSVGSYMAMLLVVASVLALEQGMVSDPQWYSLLWITIPLLVICIFLLTGRQR